MAKALIAAIALAVVLVAAVVVPLVVLPGTSGFDQWPTHTPQAPHEQIVDLTVPAAPSVRVESRPRSVAPHVVTPRRQFVHATPKPVSHVRVEATPQPQPQKPQPASQTPAPAQQPQAAPEAPLTPPVAEARDVSDDTPALDGTNQP